MAQSLFSTGVQKKVNKIVKSVNSPTGGPFTTLASSGQPDFMNIGNYTSDFMNLSDESEDRRPLADVVRKNLLIDKTHAEFPPEERPRGTLQEAIGRGVWSALDSATFHASRLLVTDDGESLADHMMGKSETRAGKYGEAIGEAAGFLAPFAGVGKVASFGVKGFTKYGSKKVAKELSDSVATAAATKGEIGWISKAGESYTKAEIKGMTEKAASKKFIDAMEKQWVKPVENFSHAFRTTAQKNVFQKSVRENFGSTFKEALAKDNISVGDGAIKIIEKSFRDAFKDGRKLPVSTISDLISRRIGIDSKLGAAASLLMEEAILFAGVETIFETFNAAAEDRPSHYFDTIKHAMQMGGILGAVRLIPGGKQYGNTLLTGKEGGLAQFNRLIMSRRPFKGRTDFTKATERDGLWTLWNHFAKNDLKDGAGAPLLDIISRSAMNHKHTVNGVFKGNVGKNYIGVKSWNPASIQNVLNQPGTGWRVIKGKKVNQKQAIAEVMADGLDDVYRQFRGRWSGEFFKDYAQDFVRSTPRMFIGGIAMSGGPGIVFDDNIDMTDKLFHLSLGAFMMKRGKELKWHTKSGREVINEGGFWGRPKPWTYSETFDEITNHMKILGGNPAEHAGWAELQRNSSKSLLFYFDSLNKNAKTTEGTQVLRDEFFRQDSGKDIYFTEKEQGDVKPKNDSADLVDTRKLYEVFKEYNGNRNLSERGDGEKPLYVKEWDSLTIKQKRDFQKRMAEKDIKHENDLIDIVAEANIDTINQAQLNVKDYLITALKRLRKDGGEEGSKDQLWQMPAEGRMKFPHIRPNTDTNRKLDTEDLLTVQRYNEFVDMLVDKGVADWYSRDAVDIGMKIHTETEGVREFLNDIKGINANFNQDLGIHPESGSRISPADPLFSSFNSFAAMFTNINRARDFLVKAIYSDPNVKSNFDTPKLERAYDLINKIYRNDNNITHDLVEVQGKSYSRQRFVDGLHEIIKFHGVSRTPIGKDMVTSKKKVASVKDVDELRDLLVSEDITLFDNRNSQVREEFLYNLKRKTIKDKLKGKVWQKDGTLRDVTEGDVEGVAKLIDAGIVNEYLTAHEIPQIWGDITNPANLPQTTEFLKAFGRGGEMTAKEIADWSSKIKTSSEGEKVETLHRYLEKQAQKMVDDTSIGIDNISDARKHVSRELDNVMTQWNEVMEPYLIKTVNGQTGGILHLNRSQPVLMDRMTLMSLTAQLQYVKTKKVNQDTQKWIKILENASKNPDSEYYNFSNMLLNELSASTDNAVRFLELANRHKIYDGEKAEFIVDPTEGSPTDKINQFMESISRRNGYGSVEQLKDYYKKYEEYLQESGEPNKFHAINFGNISKDYDIIGVPLIDNKGVSHVVNDKSDVSVDKQINDIFDSFAADGQAGKDKFHKELLNVIKTNATNKGQTVDKKFEERLHTVADKLLHDITHSVSIPNLQVGINKRVADVIDSQHRLKNTDVLKSITDIVGGLTTKDGDGIIPFSFIDKKIKLENGKVGDLVGDSGGNATKINQHLYEGKAIYLEKDMQLAALHGYDASKSPILPPDSKVLYMYGGEHGFAISVNAHQKSTIINNYATHLAKQGFSKERVAEYLKEAGIEVSKDGEMAFKRDTADDMMQSVKRIMDDRIFSDLFGKDMWFNEMRNYQGVEMANLVKRLSLFNNYDSSIYSREDLLAIANRRDGSGLFTKENIGSIKKLAEGKYKKIVIRDETVDGLMDLKKKMVSDLTSQRDLYDTESDQYKSIDREMKYVQAKFEKDSMVNGITLVEDKLFDAMSSLQGATASDGIGAIKPVMLRKGEQFFVSKTAFQKDAQFKEIWEANPDVGMITFTSASKTVTKDGSYHPWMESKIVDYKGDFKDFKPAHYKGKEIFIKPEDIQILSQKGINTEATLAPNHTVGMDPVAQKQYFQQHIVPKYESALVALTEYSNPAQYMKAIGLNKARNHDMYADAINSGSHMGVGQRLAKHNMNPQISVFNPEFNNFLKKRYMDTLLSLKVNGVQATMSPDMMGELKGSILGRDSIEGYSRGKLYVIGESKLPFHSKIQTFDPNKTSLIPKISKGEDVIFEGGTGFKTEQGSEYVVDGTSTTRFKVPKTGKGPGPKEKSTVTVYMSELSAQQAFGKPFGAMQVSGDKKIGFFELGITINGKNFSAQKKPKKGLLPVEFMQSDKGTSYHVGHKIVETGITIGSKGVKGQKAHIQDTTESMKRVSKMGKDFEGLTNLGQLYEKAEAMGYDVLVAVERNPHTKPDSALLQRLRGFKAESDGANATVNAADLKRALEGDHDLDTGNFYWDMGAGVRDGYFKQRGTVSDSNPSGGLKDGLGRSSWEGVNFHDAKSYNGLLSKQLDAKVKRGTIMATQKTLEAIMNYKGSHVVPSGPNEGSNLITLEKGTALRVRQEYKDELTQRLADDIQGILDSKGEFDSAYFDNWESDFWFGKDGVFELYKYDGKKWGKSSGTLPSHAEDMVMGAIINPYKALNGLSTGTWDSGTRQSVTFDQFRAGASKFNTDLFHAERVALKIVGNKLGKDSDAYRYLKKESSAFSGLNNQMQILNKLTPGQQDGLTNYDRTMKLMYNLSSRARVRPPASVLEHEYKWEEGIFELENSTTISNPNVQDLFNVLNESIKTHAHKADFIGFLDYKIKNLTAYGRKVEDAGAKASIERSKEAYRKYRKQAIETLTYKIDKDGKAIRKVWIKGRKEGGDWIPGRAEWVTDKKKATKEESKLWNALIKETRKSLFKEAIKNTFSHEERKAAIEQFNKDNKGNRLVLKKIRKDGLQFDSMDFNEQISAVAMIDAFGGLANIEMLNNVNSKTELKYEHNTAEAYAKDLSKFVREAWSNFSKNVGKYENENRIQDEIFHRMTEYYTAMHVENPAIANLFLYKFMTPRVSAGKFMKLHNKWYLSPENPRSFGTNVKAGLRFVNDSKFFTEGEKDLFFAEVATSTNNAFLKIHGIKAGDAFNGGGVRMDKHGNIVYDGKDIHGELRDAIDATNIFYESSNPLQYSNSGTINELMTNLNPSLMNRISEGSSTLTHYETMRKLFGTGSISNIAESMNVGFVPKGTMSDYSKYGYHYAINGMGSYMKALERGHYGLMGDHFQTDGLLGNGTAEKINVVAETRRRETATERIERRKANCRQ